MAQPHRPRRTRVVFAPVVGARGRLLHRRGVRRPSPFPQAGAHALADRDRPRPRALLRDTGRPAGRAAPRRRARALGAPPPAPDQARVQPRRAIALHRHRALVFRSAFHSATPAPELAGCPLCRSARAHGRGVPRLGRDRGGRGSTCRASARQDSPRLARRRDLDRLPRTARCRAGRDSALRAAAGRSPALACGLAFRGYMQQREQREHVEFLYESMRATQGRRSSASRSASSWSPRGACSAPSTPRFCFSRRQPGEPVLRSVSSALEDGLMHPEPLTLVTQLAFEETGSSERRPILLAAGASPSRSTASSPRAGSPTRSSARSAARSAHLRVAHRRRPGRRRQHVRPRPTATLFETFAGHASVLLENGRLEQSLAQVTELKEELRHQAYHDALTGLPNRVLFTERVAEALARAQVERELPAVLFLDLDRFKNVNDSWGHAAGDELLIAGRPAPPRAIRPERHRRPARRRRVRRPAGEHRRRRCRARGAPPRRLAERAPSRSGRETAVGASIGIALTGAACDERGGSSAQRRHRDVRREGRRAPAVRGLRADALQPSSPPAGARPSSWSVR